MTMAFKSLDTINDLQSKYSLYSKHVFIYEYFFLNYIRLEI